MNTHIVRVNEKIEKIAGLYSLSVEEIIKINQHIKDWDHLIPGTKLRLPQIPEMIQAELDNTEPFIEEYYPKLELDDYLKKEENTNIIEGEVPKTPKKDESLVTQEQIEPSKIKKYPTYHSYYGMPYPYYGYYPNYYRYPYQNTRRKGNTKKKG